MAVRPAGARRRARAGFAADLPAGFVRGERGPEMPQNIMLTGRLDDEATLLDAGFVFERETDWRTRRPPLFISRG